MFNWFSEFYREELCGGGECESELCLFSKGRGAYMYVCMWGMGDAHCMFTKYNVCVSVCKQQMQ